MWKKFQLYRLSSATFLRFIFCIFYAQTQHTHEHNKQKRHVREKMTGFPVKRLVQMSVYAQNFIHSHIKRTTGRNSISGNKKELQHTSGFTGCWLGDNNGWTHGFWKKCTDCQNKPNKIQTNVILLKRTPSHPVITRCFLFLLSGQWQPYIWAEDIKL